jgi:hypothetical protein
VGGEQQNKKTVTPQKQKKKKTVTPQQNSYTVPLPGLQPAVRCAVSEHQPPQGSLFENMSHLLCCSSNAEVV